MRSETLLYTSLATALLGTLACRGATEPTVVAGSYFGMVQCSASAIAESYDITFILSDAGGKVTGTWSAVNCVGSGTIVGTVSGTTLSATMNQTSPCPASYTMTADADEGTRLDGSYSGTACLVQETGAVTHYATSGGFTAFRYRTP